MKFYYENMMGETGYFTLKKTEIVKAIMSAWNIEAELYIVEKVDRFSWDGKLIFSPHEDNIINNELLKQYGLYVTEGEKFRELRYIKDNSLAVEPDCWDNVLDLV